MSSIRLIATAIGLVLAVGSGAVALADETGSPTKEQIIKALNTPPDTTTRGFVQVPGTKPAPAPVPAVPAAAHTAVPASPHGAALPISPASTGGSADHASIGVPVLFDLNSASIKPESHATLESIAAALNSPSLKEAHILIEGHTDGRGSSELNQALSEERANAVEDYLVQTGGVAPDRLASVGKGSNEPVDPGKPLSPENRRVVLVNLNK